MKSLARVLFLLFAFNPHFLLADELWTLTSYFELSRTAPYGLYTETTAVPIAPTVSVPIAITTSIGVYEHNSFIPYHSIILKPGQGKPISTAFNGDSDETITKYHFEFTFSKPPGCTISSDKRSTTSTKALALPNELGTLLSPITTQTVYDDDYYNYGASPTRHPFFDATQLPDGLVDAMEQEFEPGDYKKCRDKYYRHDGNFSMCDPFTYKFGAFDIGGGYDCSNGRWDLYGVRPWVPGVIVVASCWMALTILIGILQSIIRFRALMMGESARRGLPTAFIWPIPLLTAPLFGSNRKVFPARLPEERELLRIQWKTTPLPQKIKLWLKYGFTYGYPPTLGPAPEWPARPVEMRNRPTAATQTRATRTTNPAAQEEQDDPPPPYQRAVTPPPPSRDTTSSHAPTAQGSDRPDSPPKYEDITR